MRGRPLGALSPSISLRAGSVPRAAGDSIDARQEPEGLARPPFFPNNEAPPVVGRRDRGDLVVDQIGAQALRLHLLPGKTDASPVLGMTAQTALSGINCSWRRANSPLNPARGFCQKKMRSKREEPGLRRHRTPEGAEMRIASPAPLRLPMSDLLMEGRWAARRASGVFDLGRCVQQGDDHPRSDPQFPGEVGVPATPFTQRGVPAKSRRPGSAAQSRETPRPGTYPGCARCRPAC